MSPLTLQICEVFVVYHIFVVDQCRDFKFGTQVGCCKLHQWVQAEPGHQMLSGAFSAYVDIFFYKHSNAT